MAVSPDGTSVVYAGMRGGTEQLYLRPVGETEPTPLVGTEGGRMPFFSPDGQWIGFFADGQLKKTSVAGGPTVAICDVRSPLGGSWAADDSILFSSRGGLASVSANGGAPRETTGALATGGRSHRWPDMLPDGKSVLHTAFQDASDTGNVNILSLETGEERLLVENGTSARYVASGHIVFAREGVLFAIPFDQERMETSGAAIPVLEDVGWGGAGEAYFDVSDEGTLVYIAGQTKPEAGLVAVNRKGESRPLGPRRRANWYGLELSPDDRSVVVAIEPQIAPPDLWVLDKARETLTRLTFSEARGNRNPVWSPNGRRIFFWAADTVASIEVDGSDRDLWIERGALSRSLEPTSLSSDQEVLVVGLRPGQDGNWDVGALRLDGAGEVETLLGGGFDERRGNLSPDDRWLAYESNETGRFEVYVQPFPVSTDGGTEPRWSRNGNEIFYRNGDQMLVVSTITEGDFRAGKPTLLFEGSFQARATTSATNYDVSADGQEFVMIRNEDSSAPPQIHVVLNWFEELKRLVPTN